MKKKIKMNCLPSGMRPIHAAALLNKDLQGENDGAGWFLDRGKLSGGLLSNLNSDAMKKAPSHSLLI